VLRVSEDNGYNSPWSVYRLADMKSNEMKTPGVNIEKLARIINWPEEKLDTIAYSAPPGQPRWCRLLGHPVLPQDLNLTHPRFCPQCLREKGFLEAHWDLALMVACPVHQCSLASSCPECGRRLRWFRRGLLECECGGDLSDGELSSVSNAEASLVDIIRRSAMSSPSDESNPMSLPQDQLMAMGLRSMLLAIRTIAKHRILADETGDWSNHQEIVSAAARVLVEWPANFIALLEDIGRQLPADISGGVGKQFGGIYRGLFRNKAMGDPKQTEFLRVAFLDFAMNHWGRGFVDHKIIQRLGGTGPKRFLTQTEFAAKIGVQQSTAARLLRNSSLASKRVKCGAAVRIVVDIDQMSIPRTWPGKIFRVREAAKRLGISVSVLRALQSSGIYEVNHLLPTRAGFHELDLEAFTKKLLDLAPDQKPTSIRGKGTITLQSVLCGRRDSLEVKLNLLRAILSRDIAVLHNSNGTVGGLAIEGDICQRIVADARSHVPAEIIYHCCPAIS
jgi:transcriptional regulator with XRE-family HTH domain